MEGPSSGSLVQRFRSIVFLASLAYAFTVLHALQYSMQNHDDSNSQTPQLDDYSALSSTHDTPATTTSAETVEKNKRWTDQEIELLLNYVERNSILTTQRGLNLKKSEFRGASNMIKTKDPTQCHSKWGRVGVFVISENFIILIYYYHSYVLPTKRFHSGTRSLDAVFILIMVPTYEPQVKSRFLKIG
jgi:hypothetical protein